MEMEIVKRLGSADKEIRLWRRRACKFIRENYHKMEDGTFKNQIRHKANGGWLGDYDNTTLISIIRTIVKGG